MIHTVALNPAIDQTVTIPSLVPGEVSRADAVRLDPGGKAVNVASVLSDWGMPVTIHGLLGQNNANVFEALFADKNIADRMIRVAGATRTNIKLLEPGGRTTDINLPGFAVEADAADAVAATLANVVSGDLVVVSGSQPVGLAPDLTANLVATLTARGARVVLDVSGAPLQAALASAKPPFAVKPNRHELQEVTGRDLSTPAAVVAAAHDMIQRGIALVVVSMGTDGALFLTADDGIIARPAQLATGSTVGAGDAMVAGLTAAIAQGQSLPDLARQATAFAAGKLQNAGPHLPPKATVQALAETVEIRPLADWLGAA